MSSSMKIYSQIIKEGLEEDHKNGTLWKNSDEWIKKINEEFEKEFSKPVDKPELKE